MNQTEKLLFARNELENIVNSLQSTLELSEADMMWVCESLLSTARYKTYVKDVYEKVKKKDETNKKGGSDE